MDQTSHPAAAAFCRRCNRLWRAGVKSRVLTFFKYLHDCELSRIILKMSIWANLALAACLTAAMMSVLSAVAASQCVGMCRSPTPGILSTLERGGCLSPASGSLLFGVERDSLAACVTAYPNVLSYSCFSPCLLWQSANRRQQGQCARGIAADA